MPLVKTVLEDSRFTLIQGDTEQKFSGVYTGDLLSDVMGHAKEGDILVTIQGHRNTVAVASLTGFPAVLLCNNRQPDDGMKQAADQEHIALITTRLTQFQVSVILGKLLEQ